MKDIMEPENQMKLINHLNRYKDSYGIALLPLYEGCCKKEISVHTIAEIYAYLDFLDQEENIYYQFMQNVKQKQNLGCHILDVSCGHLPILAREIRKEQIKLKKGTITCIDPLVFPLPLDGIHVVKGFFPKDIDVKQFDLLVGMRPCEATIPMMEQAYYNQIPYSILPCGDSHLSRQELEAYQQRYPRESEMDLWRRHLARKALKTIDTSASLELSPMENHKTLVFHKVYKK